MLGKIRSRGTQTVVSALIRRARKLPGELYKSLTWDRGPELADHKRFSMATDAPVNCVRMAGSPWSEFGEVQPDRAGEQDGRFGPLLTLARSGRDLRRGDRAMS